MIKQKFSFFYILKFLNLYCDSVPSIGLGLQPCVLMTCLGVIGLLSRLEETSVQKCQKSRMRMYKILIQICIHRFTSQVWKMAPRDVLAQTDQTTPANQILRTQTKPFLWTGCWSPCRDHLSQSYSQQKHNPDNLNMTNFWQSFKSRCLLSPK